MQSPNASIPPCGAPPSWRAGARCLPTGHAALSAELPDGGWPMGSLVELLSPHPGVGEIRLLRPALSQLETRRPIALVQPPHAPNIVSWMSWRLDPRQLLWVCPENRRTRSGPPSRSSGTAAAAPCSAGCPRSAPNRCAGCIWRPRPATCCSSPCVRPPPPPTPRPPLAAGAGARAGRTVRPYPQAPGPACDTPLHVGLEPGAFETPARHAPLDRRLPALPAAGRHTPALA